MTSGKPVSSNAKSLHMHKTWSVASGRDNHVGKEVKHRKERREAIPIPTFHLSPGSIQFPQSVRARWCDALVRWSRLGRRDNATDC